MAGDGPVGHFGRPFADLERVLVGAVLASIGAVRNALLPLQTELLGQVRPQVSAGSIAPIPSHERCIRSRQASAGSFPRHTTVVLRVTDASNNTATCSFTVTVNDTELPKITCPTNIVANVDPGTCSAVVTYSIITSDNCTVASTIRVSGLASGATFPLGTTTIVYRVTDNSNNSATCSFTVTVVDNIPPSINCPSNINRNVILDNFNSLCQQLSHPGILLISGILDDDIDEILKAAFAKQLILDKKLIRSNWVSLKFIS